MEDQKKSKGLSLADLKVYWRLLRGHSLSLFFYIATSTAFSFLEMISVGLLLPIVGLLVKPDEFMAYSFIKSLAEFLDHATPQRLVVILVLGLGFLIIVKNVLWVYNQLHFQKLIFRIREDFGLRMFCFYITKPYREHLSIPHGEITKNTTQEINDVTGTLMLVGGMFKEAVVVVLFIGMIFTVAPWVALAGCLLLGPGFLILRKMGSHQMTEIGTRLERAYAEVFTLSSQTFICIKQVKLTSSEGFLARQYLGWLQKIREWTMRSQFAKLVPRFVMEITIFAGIVGLIAFRVFATEDLYAFFPTFVVLVFAVNKLLPSLEVLAKNYLHLGLGLRTADIVAQCLETPPEIRDDNKEPFPREAFQSLEMRDVSFRYRTEGDMVLSHVQMKIERGSRVGLVGLSGAGKTTLEDLLMGLLQPEGGQILVNGEPLDEEKSQRWRKRIGYVPQNVLLFNDTVSRNIAYGLEDAQRNADRVQQVAAIAHAEQFVEEMPEKYETNLGDLGGRLSGGQRQRIAIARALYHDPEVIIFDEATSALDNQTERQVVENLERSFGREKTIIVVAHRLSTIRNCDVIYVMKNGRLVASGTHDVLMRSSEDYQALYALGEKEPAAS